MILKKNNPDYHTFWFISNVLQPTQSYLTECRFYADKSLKKNIAVVDCTFKSFVKLSIVSHSIDVINFLFLGYV